MRIVKRIALAVAAVALAAAGFAATGMYHHGHHQVHTVADTDMHYHA